MRSVAELRSSDNPPVGEPGDHIPRPDGHQLERFKPSGRMDREAHDVDETIYGNNCLCDATGRVGRLIIL